ncbi:MAG: ATP-binding protein [bacterium]
MDLNPQHAESARPNLPGEIHERRRIILRELKVRAFWFIRLRWLVPPGIVAATALARFAGAEIAAWPILAVAALILAYNLGLFAWGRRFGRDPSEEAASLRRFARWQVGLDYGAMFLLIHLTGGAASPLLFFFIFHIIFASILLPSRSAYGFSALAVAGVGLLTGAEYLGWIPHHPLHFQGKGIELPQPLFHLMVAWGFFAATVIITAFATSSIMQVLRRRIDDLVELSETVADLNDKLGTLYTMVQAIGSAQKFDLVLQTVVRELASVMEVKGISVKLLSENGRVLRYAAAHGLPESIFKNRVVEVAKSPLNRRIIDGEPFITGQVTQKEMFQFGEDLAAAQLQSVLFLPLTVEERVIGILGAYCVRPDRFGSEEVEFFRLAAGLVAIALENAKAYESIESLVKERAWFTMRVAHNLRAPLAAMKSILDVVQGGYLGELNADQREYLRRLNRRTDTLLATISELMTLARSRSEKIRVADEPVDLPLIATRIDRTFRDEASGKGLEFKMTVPEELPVIRGDAAMIEQMLENLVSNAIKYTPAGGKVSVAFSKGGGNVRIEVGDTGIGIPSADLPNLFREFYRSESAKAVEAHGTGLGLPIVKEIVDKHGGRIMVESEEGLGTIFVVCLPIDRRAGRGDGAALDATPGQEEGGQLSGQPGRLHRPLLSVCARAAVAFVREAVRSASEQGWIPPWAVRRRRKARQPVAAQ